MDLLRQFVALINAPLGILLVHSVTHFQDFNSDFIHINRLLILFRGFLGRRCDGRELVLLLICER